MIFDEVHYVVEHDEAGNHHWNLAKTLCGKTPSWGYVAHVHGRGVKNISYGGYNRELGLAGELQAVNCPACLELDAEARLLGTHFLLCPDCKGSGEDRRYLKPGEAFRLGPCPCSRCETTGLVLAGHGGRSPIP